PHEVDTEVGVGTSAPDGFLEAAADGAERIRPRDDDEVRVVLVSHVDGGPIFPDRLFATHDRLSRDVTATLRTPLVLEVNPGDARLDEFLDGTHRAQRIAVAVIDRKSTRLNSSHQII